MEGGREEKKWGGERERTEGKEAKPAYISEYNKKCVWGGAGSGGVIINSVTGTATET